MAFVESNLNIDSAYTRQYDDDYEDDGVSTMEMIAEEFQGNDLDSYSRCDKFPSVPFRMIVVGSSGSGKSTLIRKLYEQNREFYCKRDSFTWYGNKVPYPKDPNTWPPHDQTGRQHSIVVYDDPDDRYFNVIRRVFQHGRPKGISPVVIIHSWDQLIGSPALRVLKNQANIVCLCQEAASEVKERHALSFDGFLKCPNSSRKSQLLQSIDGNFDYNWITNGKCCKNIRIGYPKTLSVYKKRKIDPIIQGISSSSSSSSSSDDDDDALLVRRPSSEELKDAYLQLHAQKQRCI